MRTNNTASSCRTQSLVNLIKGEKTGKIISPLALLPTKLPCSDQASGSEIYTKSEGQEHVDTSYLLLENVYLWGLYVDLKKGAALPRTEPCFRQGEDSAAEDFPSALYAQYPRRLPALDLTKRASLHPLFADGPGTGRLQPATESSPVSPDGGPIRSRKIVEGSRINGECIFMTLRRSKILMWIHRGHCCL